jgi:NAD(P)-dependent dehydrogenase (short-subunit alcohol dehydrogenase family)
LTETAGSKVSRFRLSGKTALITGGTRGIGAAVVRSFLAEGAKVVFSGRTEESVTKAQVHFGGDGTAIGIAAELEDAAAPAKLAKAALRRAGHLDILVNNAGIVTRANEWELTPEEWDRVQAVNVRAAFFLSQMVGRDMCERGCGSIINFSSIAGQHGGVVGSPAYGAAKAAIIGMTRSLARRFGPRGVRVNCIAPADINTDMTASWSQDLRQKLIDLTPLNRFGESQEVAAAAVFLASDESSFITGQTVSINGGAYMA